MARIVATVVLLALSAPMNSSGQTVERPSLVLAGIRELDRLDRQQEPQNALPTLGGGGAGWQDPSRFWLGRELVVVTATATLRPRYFVSSTDNDLTVLDLGGIDDRRVCPDLALREHRACSHSKIETIARDQIVRIEGCPGSRGTFFWQAKGLVFIGTAVTGLVFGNRWGRSTDHPFAWGTVGAVGGLYGGIATGVAAVEVGQKLEGGPVLYRRR